MKIRVALNLIHHKYNRNKNAQKIKSKCVFILFLGGLADWVTI